MTWCRLDDGFHSHPKVLKAWNQSPAAVGLHARAMAYAADHEIDGKVPEEILQMWVQDEDTRAELVAALEDAGLWQKNGSGYFIHDFLDYNPSREEITERRTADRERKRAERGSPR